VNVSNFKLAASENDLSAFVNDYSRLQRWRRVHFRPAKVGERWVTALEGDVGWPDWALVRSGRFVVAELKSEKGRLGPGQSEWLQALGEVPGVEAYLWRPSDIPEIRRVLR
jgi:hypothetical protein